MYSLMETEQIVNPLLVIEAAVAPAQVLACLDNPSLLRRHGGLIRKGQYTVRVCKGGYRCPHCNTVLSSCSAEPLQPSLPLWHQDVQHYITLVGSHGLPEEDRPQQCPKCHHSKHKPHRHSHYERTVLTFTQSRQIYIFRFRCSACGYVHSVIPAFLEPYQQMSLDLQEELVEAVHQGATVEAIAERTQALPCGGFDEHTLACLVRSWNNRLTQLASGLWAWLLTHTPHLTLPHSPSLWNDFRSAWPMIRQRISAFREIHFLHGLNRLHFSMTVTVHGPNTT